MSTKYVAFMLLFASLGLMPLISHPELYNPAKSSLISSKNTSYTLVGDALLGQNPSNFFKSKPPQPKIYKVWVTGYSSTVEETDDDPFITASGIYVYKGIAAANFLPIGTAIRIPEVFADQIFVIEDRMHPKNNYKVDIWFPDKQEAKEFGAKFTKVEVL